MKLRYFVLAVCSIVGWALSPLRAGADEGPAGVARAMYDAFERGDIAAIEGLLADDVEWVIHGSKALIPYVGAYRGIAGVRQFFADVDKTIRVEKHEPLRYTVEGDTVHVLGREHSVARTTGGRFTASWVHMITVRGGKIARFEEVIDTAAVTEALAPADSVRGKAYFATCAGCHGPQGQGNRFMNAPNLTGLDEAYLLRQLRLFFDGTRGTQTDFYGWQMHGRAKALQGDRALRDVVAYIQTLPAHQPTPRVKGDAKAGSSHYAACSACHGERAEGNAQVNGPALRGLDDWYIVRQLENYRSGIRGTHADDALGAQMRPAALALPNEKALRDLAAYIATIK
jgi:cytochrome c553